MLENCHGRRKPTKDHQKFGQVQTTCHSATGWAVRPVRDFDTTMSITTRLEPSRGFHPVSVSDIVLEHAEGCNLALQFDLPPEVFVDPHELALRSNAYTFAYDGSRDLEKPVNALDYGRNALSVYSILSLSSNLTVEVPLHLRYGPPAPNGGNQVVTIPWPRASIECTSTPTVQLNPISDSPFDTLFLPLGSQADLSSVQFGTAATILACFFYIAYTARATSTRLFKYPVEKTE